MSRHQRWIHRRQPMTSWRPNYQDHPISDRQKDTCTSIQPLTILVSPAKKKLRRLPGQSEQLSITNWLEMGFLTTRKKASSWLRWEGCRVCKWSVIILVLLYSLKKMNHSRLPGSPVRCPLGWYPCASFWALLSTLTFPALTLQQTWGLSLGSISLEEERVEEEEEENPAHWYIPCSF